MKLHPSKYCQKRDGFLVFFFFSNKQQLFVLTVRHYTVPIIARIHTSTYKVIDRGSHCTFFETDFAIYNSQNQLPIVLRGTKRRRDAFVKTNSHGSCPIHPNRYDSSLDGNAHRKSIRLSQLRKYFASNCQGLLKMLSIRLESNDSSQLKSTRHARSRLQDTQKIFRK